MAQQPQQPQQPPAAAQQPQQPQQPPAAAQQPQQLPWTLNVSGIIKRVFASRRVWNAQKDSEYEPAVRRCAISFWAMYGHFARIGKHKFFLEATREFLHAPFSEDTCNAYVAKTCQDLSEQKKNVTLGQMLRLSEHFKGEHGAAIQKIVYDVIYLMYIENNLKYYMLQTRQFENMYRQALLDMPVIPMQ